MILLLDLHELAGLACQTPCCSSPSDSLFHKWLLARASRPPCPGRLCRPGAPSDDPAEIYVEENNIRVSLSFSCATITKTVSLVVCFAFYPSIMKVKPQLQLHKHRLQSATRFHCSWVCFSLTCDTNFWYTCTSTLYNLKSINIILENFSWRLHLSSRGGRTGYIRLWPLLQALHIHAVHHSSQPRLCFQLQNKTLHLFFSPNPFLSNDFISEKQKLEEASPTLKTVWILCGASKRAFLRVRVWVEPAAEDCGEANGRLGRERVCGRPKVYPHFLHTWTLVWGGSLCCWNNSGTDCGVKTIATP